MQIKELLKDKLIEKEIKLIPSSFDFVGDILIFSDFPKELRKKERIIGETFLKSFKNVKVILKKTEKYSGKFRLPKYKIIAGEKRKETIYKENGVLIKLDVEKVYFSPRLANERLRMAKLVKKNEKVLVMFSGSGVYPLVISKNSSAKEIVGIELNSLAHKYAEENIKLNKLKNIKLIKGDVKKTKLNEKFDRIIMPLPKGAEDYLKYAFKVAKKKATIHFYSFFEENKFEDIVKNLEKSSKNLRKKIKIINVVKCGQFSPRVYRVCVDFRVL